MKKIMMTAVAVSFVFILAMPAMAIEFEVEGHYYSEGVYNEHPDLRDNHQNDYMAMELRLQPEFTFSDNLKLITRFDALGKKWGNDDNSQVSSTTVGIYNAAGFAYYRTATSIDDDDEFKDDANIDNIYLSDFMSRILQIAICFIVSTALSPAATILLTIQINHYFSETLCRLPRHHLITAFADTINPWRLTI